MKCFGPNIMKQTNAINFTEASCRWFIKEWKNWFLRIPDETVEYSSKMSTLA